MAGLTDAEKEKCRYHLGYLGAQLAPSMVAGIPKPIETLFILETSLTQILNPFVVDRVRRTLFQLDSIEERLRNAACVLVAEQLGDIKLRGATAGETYPDLLEREYVRWAKRLADILGAPLYPYSSRFKSATGVGSIPVRR